MAVGLSFGHDGRSVAGLVQSSAGFDLECAVLSTGGEFILTGVTTQAATRAQNLFSDTGIYFATEPEKSVLWTRRPEEAGHANAGGGSRE